MTIALWQDVLSNYMLRGTHNEKLMARMLMSLTEIDDPLVVRMFDCYASEILETKGTP